jgi:hypothetical protein
VVEHGLFDPLRQPALTAGSSGPACRRLEVDEQFGPSPTAARAALPVFMNMRPLIAGFVGALGNWAKAKDP